jgi:hypothetical protein
LRFVIERSGEVRMLRRLAEIGMLMLTATGCAQLGGRFGDASSGDAGAPAAPVPIQSAHSSGNSGSPSSASLIPTTDTASSTPSIQPVQATFPHWEKIMKQPDPANPPTVVLDKITVPEMKKQQEMPADEPIVAAVRYVIQGNGAEADLQLQTFSPATREVFLQLLPFMELLSRKDVEALDVNDSAVLERILGELSTMIRPRAALSIPTLCFCEAISGHMVYRPLPEDHAFLAARGDRPGELVQLYMAMKNLGSRPDGRQFVTDLNCTVEIADETGRPRWSHRFRPEDLRLSSPGPLNEYYHNFSFYLPASLTPGSYRLTVRLSDRTHADAPRDATASTPLRIVGDR